jgi:WD40 repeat protein
LQKTPPRFTKIISGYKWALQITFWDAYDCQAIRLIDGSLSSEMNCLDITPDGEGFVSGGVDREVKLWNYDEGHCYFVGLGHSGPITKVINPPFLHPFSPQFVCPKFPQILKGTFLDLIAYNKQHLKSSSPFETVVLCIH